jgi:hypothetical protein
MVSFVVSVLLTRSKRRRMRFGFMALGAEHQRLDCSPHIATSLEHSRHLRRNWQLYAVTRTERKRRGSSFHAFGDHFHARENFAELTATGQLNAHVTVPAQRSRTGQYQIAQPAQT